MRGVCHAPVVAVAVEGTEGGGDAAVVYALARLDICTRERRRCTAARQDAG